MSRSLLDKINSPDDLKSLTDRELEVVAAEIRLRLISVTSRNGGHLASSLGATDIIVAMHAVYNSPVDKLVYDTGHQAYAHKLLTGRRDDFNTLRQYGGLSGFIRMNESVHDVYDSGHASDALSIAMGLTVSRDLAGRHERVVVLVGDAGLSGGLAFEALNQVGHEQRDMTIILNDNEMSIAKNVGALSLYLTRVRSSRPYIRTRDTIEERLSRFGDPGRFLVDMGERMRDSVKLFLIGGTFFEDMGITYLGPVDGHSIEQLRMVMQSSQQIAGPVLIHAFTKKGRGYLPAEADPELFHGASRFDIATGIFSTGSTARSYTDYFSDALVAEAKIDQRIVAITAAMPLGTGLDCFKQRFPSRFIDVGIAEEHAVASAAGMAIGGSLPVVAIYSSFLQRAYDQLMINVGLANQHVVFCLDRAGLVGEDGATHHGAFDLSYLRSIPNMQILAPAFGDQLADALHTALRLDGPVALRFPRGEAPSSLIDESGHTHESHTEQRRHQAVFLEPGRAQLLLSGSDVALLAVGSMVKPSLEAARLLAEDDISVAVYNMIWVKPIDYELVASLNHPLIVTLEEGSLVGGFGSAVLEVLSERKPQKADCLQKTLRIGIPDRFVGHGSQRELLVELGLDSKSIAATVRAALVDLVLTDQASADPASVDGQVTTSTRTDL